MDEPTPDDRQAISRRLRIASVAAALIVAALAVADAISNSPAFSSRWEPNLPLQWAGVIAMVYLWVSVSRRLR